MFALTAMRRRMAGCVRAPAVPGHAAGFRTLPEKRRGHGALTAPNGAGPLRRLAPAACVLLSLVGLWPVAAQAQDEGGAVPTVSVAPVSTPVAEGEDAQFTVTRTVVTTGALTVNYRVSESRYGGDMVASGDEGAKTVDFADGESEKTVTVPTEDDALDERHSTVTLTLTADATYELGADATAKVTVEDDDNGRAFGAPTIDDTRPVVGETLTADASGITDLDGLTGATYAWRWVRVRSRSFDTVETEVGTGATYTVVAADVGATLKVEATFTDDGGTEETVESRPTLTVVAPPPPPPENALVSNTSRAGGSAAAGHHLSSFAQQFTTGSASRGYDLSSVVLAIDFVGSVGSFSVAIRESRGDGSPGVVRYRLINPPSDVGGRLHEYSAPAGATLEAGTVYHVVVSGGGSGDYGEMVDRFGWEWASTAGTTDPGAAPGWSIGTSWFFRHIFYGGGDPDIEPDQDRWLSSTNGASLKIQIRGTEAEGNTLPTGAPTIDDTTPVLGETLTADASGITDADGLTGATYAWRWFRVSRSGNFNTFETEVGTGATYTVVAADVGVTLKVEASFTDDGGTDETVESAETATVEAPRVSVRAVSHRVQEGEDAQFTVTRTGLTTGALTVHYRVSERGGDMVASGEEGAKTVAFADGDTEKTVTVPTVDDTGYEADSLVILRLLENIYYLRASVSDWVMVEDDDNTDPTGAPTIDDTTPVVGETLTADASGIADADGPANLTFAWQWFRGRNPIPGATSETYTVVVADVGRTLKVEASFTDDGGVPEAVQSAETAVVEAAPPPEGVDVLVSNTALFSFSRGDGGGHAQPFTTGSASGGYDLYSVVLAMTNSRWPRNRPSSDAVVTIRESKEDGTPGDIVHTLINLPSHVGGQLYEYSAPAGATLEASTVYHVVVEGDDVEWKLGTSSTDPEAAPGWEIGTSSWSRQGDTWSSFDRSRRVIQVRGAAKDDGNADPTGAPTIDDTTPRVGETLTADASGIADADGLTSPTFAWQWIRVSGGTETPISGATAATYTVVAADLGATLKVEASFTDDGGTDETVASAETAAVAAAPPEVTVAPETTPATEGDTITFTLTRTGDPAETLDVDYEVTATGDFGVTTGAGTATFPADGATVQVSVDTTGDDTHEAHGSVTLTLTADTGADPAYLLGDPATATAAVEDDDDSPATGTVTVTTATAFTEGETLTADTSGLADEDGLSNAAYTYQWVRTPAGGGDADISGATGATYVPVYADAGATLKVKVTVTDDEGHEAEFTSTPISAVAALPRPEVTVTSDGDVTEGSAAVFTLTRTGDTAQTLDMAWEVTVTGDFGAATGAGTATFPANSATVQVSVATTGDGAHEAHGSVTLTLTADTGADPAYLLGDPSTATAAVEDDDDSPATGTVTVTTATTFTEGETLTADTSGLTDEDGLSNAAYTYQWVRTPAGGSDADISGATSQTYVPVFADAGATLKVKVTVTDDEGHEASFTSAPTSAVAALPRPSVTVASDGDVTEGSAAVFTLTRTGDTAQTLDMAYEVTATGDFGVTTGAGSATFLANDSTVQVSLTTTGDDTHEAHGSVTLTLTADTGADPAYLLGAPATATAAVEDDDDSPTTGSVTVTGTATEGETLTANTSGLTDEDGLDKAAYAYQWVRTPSGGSDEDISGATGATYVPVFADAGATLKVRVTVTDDEGHEATFTSAPTSAVAAASRPSVTVASPEPDYVTEGETITFTLTRTGDLAGTLDVAYEVAATGDFGVTTGAGTVTFLADSPTVQVSVATTGDDTHETHGSVTLTLTEDTSADPAYLLGAPSTATAAVEDDDDSPATGAVATTGDSTHEATVTTETTFTEGETLTANTSGLTDEDGLSNAAYTYQWVRTPAGGSDADISGATSQTYVPVFADAGATLKVKVTVTDDEGHEASFTSAPTSAVAALPRPSVTVVSDGDVTEGSPAEFTLTRTGDLAQTLDVAYAVTATGDFGVTPSTDTATFLANSATVQVSVDTTGDSTHEAHGSVTVTLTAGTGADPAYVLGDPSAATAAVEDDDDSPASGTVTVTGTPTEGETLTANTAGLTDADGLADAAYTYQWVRTPAGGSDADISGATSKTYVPVFADAGARLKVRVTVTDDEGHEASFTSAPTSAVAALPRPSVTVVSDGDVTEGSPAEFTLTRTGDLAQTLDVAYAVTATGDFGAATGAGTATFLANSATVQVSVDTTGDSTHEAHGSVTVTLTADTGADPAYVLGDPSAATAAVEDDDDSPASGTVTVTGTATEGETLTANTAGLTDADGLADADYAYQWVRTPSGGSDADISGATSQTYVPVFADAGARLKVRVTVTDDEGHEASFTSAPTSAVAVLPRPSVTVVSDGDVTEGSPAEFTLTRTGDTAGTLEVDYEVTATGDFGVTPFSGTATFLANSATVQVTVPTTDDGAHEADGSVTLTLQANPVAYELGTDDTATVTVEDDDEAPPPMVGTLVSNAAKSGSGNVQLVIDHVAQPFTTGGASNGYDLHSVVVEIRFPGSDVTVTIRESNAQGDPAGTLYTLVNPPSRVDDSDWYEYRAPANATLEAGTTYHVVAQRVTGGTKTWRLTGTSGADPGSASGWRINGRYLRRLAGLGAWQDGPGRAAYCKIQVRGTESASEPLPTVAVEPIASPVAEDADAQFRVTRTGDTAGALTVNYGVSETGDMVASGEEGAKSVDFADGESEKTVTVPTAEDTVHEADSVVTLTLTADAAYDLGTDATADVTVEDDDNAVPTGEPMIDDTTPVVGQTLTADESGIADADGLTGATFTWQWIRVASGGTPTEIAGETAANYTVVVADVGSTLKVEARFTDDDGTNETVESAETAVVEAAEALPELSIGDASVDEGDSGSTTLDFTVTLSEAATEAVTVEWATSDGTATAGTDYTAGNGTLTFNAGDSSKTVSVTVAGDNVDEPDETFEVTLTNPSGATLGDDTATGTITNDDDPPTVTLVLTPDTITEAGGVSTVTATLDHPSSEETTVTVTATPVSPAVAGDYTLSGSELTIAVDATTSTGTVTITAVDNAVDAPHKRVTVSATATNGQGITAPQDVTLTVTDDENVAPTGRPTIDDKTPVVGETLTVDTSGIGDSDGLAGVAYAYRWLRVAAGGAETEVGTGQSYTVVAEDVGSTLKVEVTFTDEGGAEERVESVVTAAAEAPPLPTVSVARVATPVSEGADAQFTVTRTVVTAGALTVAYSVSETGDMVASGEEGAKTVAFADGESEKTVDVPTAEDTGHEADSTVTLTLTANAAYELGTDATATVTVEDDDNAAPTGAPTIDDTTPVVGETLTADASNLDDPDGLTNRSFTWRWIRVSGGTGTPIAGATSETYTVVAGDVGLTLKVEASFTDDDGTAEAVESAETATVEAAPLPTVSVARVESPVEEGEGAQFTVTRTVVTAGALTVRYSVSESGDMVAPGEEGAQTVDFADGESEKTVTVPTVDDTGHEADSTVTLTLTADAAWDLGTDATATVTVEDDDNAAPTGKPTIDDTAPVVGETLTADPSGIDDPDGLTSPTYAWQWLRVSGGTETPISGATTASYTVVDGDVGSTLKVKATFTDDDGTEETVESAETATVEALPALSIADASVDEGDTGSATLDFTVTLDRAATETVTVDWTTSDGTATAGTDYTAGTGTLTFNSGDSSKTVSVTVAGDEVDEPNETFTVTLSSESGATIEDGAATGTITDDDDPPTVTLVLAPDTITEDGGVSTVTATLDHPSSESTTVTVTATPESPAVAGDYTLSANRELTIPAGETDSTGTVTITAVDNDVDAPHKTVTVSATATNALGITDPQDVTLTVTDDENVAPTGAPTIDNTTPVVGETLTADESGIVDSDGLAGATFTWRWIRVASGGGETEVGTGASYTVVAADVGSTLKVVASFTDDDGTAETVESAATGVVEAAPIPTVSVARVSTPVAEGAGAQFTVTRTVVTAGALTVNYRVSETGDMVASGEEGAQTVDFADGESEKTVTVPTVGDTGHEADSTVTLTLTADAAYELGTDATATVTVEDDDNAAPTGAPTIDDTTPVVGETLTADASGIADADGLTGATYAWRWLRVASGGGETEVGTGATYTVVAGDVGARLKVEAAFTDDDGTPETVESAATGVVEAAPVPTVSVEPVSSSVEEGEHAQFTVTRTVVTTGALTVRYGVSETGDMVASGDEGAKTLDFSGNTTSLTVTVPTVEDSAHEADSTVTVTLTADAAYRFGANRIADVTVEDDDNAAPAGAPTIDDTTPVVGQTLTADESGITDADGLTGATYAWRWLRVASGGGETEVGTGASYTVVDGDMGSTLKVEASFTDDDGTDEAVESAETMTVEAAPVLPALSIADASVDEGDSGSTTLDFTVTLDRAATATVTVDWATSDGTATAGTDYTAGTGTLTFNSGDSSKTVSVTVAGDNVDEPNETFTVTLSSESGATIEDGTATGTITDDDATPTVTLVLTPDTITEDGGVSTVTATLDHPSSESTTVTVTAAPVSPAVAGDYTLSGSRLTIAAGETTSTGTVTITAVDNTVDAPHKTVTVSATATNAQGIMQPQDVTLTVTDDENAAPTGVPTIDDTTPVVGETLTADESDIADADGLTGATYVWRWLRVASGGGETEVGTGASYTVVTADVGSTLKVVVSFTDDDGTAETVESAETATVEALPEVTVASDGDVTEGSAAVFTLTRTGDTAQTLDVDYEVTATGSFGVTPGAGTATFPANSATVQVSVATTGDTTDEADGSVTLTLQANPVAYALGTDAAATVTVEDDDEVALPTVTVAPRKSPLSEGDPAAEFTVTRTGDTTAALRVRLSVSETGDMVSAGNEGGKTRTLPAGQPSAVISVPTVDDGVHEADSVVTVTLEANAAYELGSDATAEVTVEDDDNAAPTGTVTIDDTTPVVGETLTADSSGIADPDGLTGATFTWQWIRVSGSTQTRISGATTASYTVVAGDVGATLKVEASFTDDDGTTETLTSAETAAAEPPPPLPALSIGDASVDEGDTGSTTLDFTVTLSRTATEAVTVDWATSDGTATAGTDYTAGNGTLTFSIGDSRKTVSVTVAGDNVDEPNETFTVTLSNPSSGATIGDGAATGTITDDDATPKVTLVLSPDSITEVNEQSTVTATLDHPSSEETTVTVSVSPDSPAVAGDYTLSTNRVLTIAAGQTESTGTVTVTSVNNTVDAPHKTVSVSATATNTQGVTAPDAVTLTIRDNDATPTVTLVLTPDSITEVNQESTVTATLNHPSSEATTVTVSVAPDSPAVAGDYALSSNRVLTIAAGQTESTGTVTVTSVNNTVDAPHKTVTVSGTATNSQGVTAPDSVTLTIRDNDATPTVTLVLTPASITEGGGTSTVTATLNHPSSEATTVTVSVAPVSPAVAGDYTLSGSELTIAAGATTSTGTVTITAVDNDVVAAAKEVTVSATATNGQGVANPGDVTLTITDDDVPGLSIADASVAEGDSGSTTMTFTVTLNPVAVSPVTVDWATADGTARAGTDYTAGNGSLTFGAGEDRKTVSVTVTGDDVDEPNETFTVRLSNASGATIADAEATGTIRDDDDAPTVTLVLSPDSITEVNQQSTVTATLDHPSSEATTVTVSISPVSPAVAGDYTLSANRELTIPAGSTTSTGTVTVTSVNNAVDAPDKTVTVSGTATNSRGVTAPDPVTLTIRDNDATPAVTLVLTPASIPEAGGTSTVTATLNHPSSEATTVTVSAAPVSPAVAGDYTLSANRELTIAAGATTSTGTVTVTGVDNTADTPDKTVTVSGTATNSQGVTAPASVALTLEDDDGPPTVTLVLSPDSITEANEQSTVTATLDRVSGADTTVTVSVSPVSPAVAGDYTLSANRELTIPAGSTTSTGTVTVTSVNNAVDAPDKTVTVSGTATNAQGVTAPASVTLTIRDNDATPTVTLVLSPASITEVNEQSTVTARLDHPSSEATTVTVSVSPDSPAVAGDYRLSTNRVLTIAAGQTTSTGTVTITAVNNTVDAPHKTVTVSGTATNSQGATAPDDVTLTIRDNDATPAVTLVLSPASIPEAGGTSTVTARLNHPSSEATTVTVSVSPVTPAVMADYMLSSNRVLTIAAGATTSAGTVTITAVDNDVVAAAKEVTVSATATNSQGVTAPDDVTLTIREDDVPGLSIADASVAEGDSGSTTMTFTVMLNPVAVSPVTVDWATADGTARAGTDYTAGNGSLTFNAGDSSKTVTVTVAGDDVDEPDETFTVTLSSASGAAIGDGTATGTIRDDDEPTVTLVLSSNSITEVDQQSTVTATLDRPSSEATTVTVSVAPVSPAVAGDYRLSTNRVLTIAAGATTSTGTVTVTSVNNTVDAPHRTVTVSGTATNRLGVTDPDSVTLTIRDNDATPTVTLVLTPASIPEAGSEADRTSTVTATLDHPSSEATTVTVSAAPVSPAVAGDYTLSGNTELTIAAGATTSTGTVTITAVDNDADAADREVTVSATATNSQGVTAPAPVTLTITNDDKATIGLSVSLGTMSLGTGDMPEEVSEGAGETTVTVTATVTGTTPLGEERTVTVSVTSGQDGAVGFAKVEDFPIVVPAGPPGTSKSETFVLSPENDEVAGADAILRVSGSVDGVNGAIVTEAMLTLTDNDEAPTGIELSVTPDTVSEGAGETTVTVTATVTGGTRFGVARTVTVSVSGSGESRAVDFAEVADFPVTIPAGAESGTGTFVLSPVDDERDELDETVMVGGCLREAGTGGCLSLQEFPVTSAQVTLTDDDGVSLSVADVVVREDAGEAVFTLRLSHPSESAVEVTATFTDGTARSGEDYRPNEERVVFGRGETERELHVDLVDDEAMERNETFEVTFEAMFESGEGSTERLEVSTPLVTCTIVDDEVADEREHKLEYALASFGRTVVQDLVTAVEDRRWATGSGTTATLAGTRLPLSEEAVYETLRRHTDPDGDLVVGTDALRELLSRSSFQLSLGGEGEAGGTWTDSLVLWGRGSQSWSAGRLDPEVGTEGEVLSGQLGVEFRPREDTLMGVMLNGSAGEMEFDGALGAEVETEVLGVHPYAQWSPRRGLRTWAMLGYGAGEATLTDDYSALAGTDLEMMMAAGGGSHEVASLWGIDWSVGTNGFFVQLDADEVRFDAEGQAALVPAVKSEVWQMRLLLEGSAGEDFVGVEGLRGNVELAARVDGGDAETGMGMEVGGGVAYGRADLGIEVEASGRVLLTHEEDGLEDAGVSLALEFDPGAPGRGLYFALAPSWGNAASGARSMWEDRQPTVGGSGGGDRFDPQMRLSSELGYTTPTPLRRGTLTTYGAFSSAGGTSRQYRIGRRLELGIASMSLEAERHESSGATPEHGIWLRGNLRF